jgi:ribosomal protein S18 acetylase RimI-like enzyme
MNITTPKGTFIIREAVIDDIQNLVNVHVTSWNATYPHHFPKPTSETRTRQWEKVFEERPDNWFCFIAQKESGEIAGFATGSKFSDDELKFDAQLNKIHFLKQYHRLGLGRILVGEVVKRFLSKGFNSMLLFADPQNSNIRFYDILQGERILTKDGNFHGTYGWKDLQTLAALCNKQ